MASPELEVAVPREAARLTVRARAALALALCIASAPGCAQTAFFHLHAPTAPGNAPPAAARRPVSVEVWAVVEGEASSEAAFAARASVMRALMASERFSAVYTTSMPAEQRLRVLIRSERSTWNSLVLFESLLAAATLGVVGVSYRDRYEVELSLEEGGRRVIATPLVFELSTHAGLITSGRDGPRFESYDAAFEAMLDEACGRALAEIAAVAP